MTTRPGQTTRDTPTAEATALTSRLAVGIDLGGTQVRAALVDDSGRLLARAAARTDIAGRPRAVMRQIEGLFAEVTNGIETRRLAGIGVSAPGPLDSEAGIVLGVPTFPGWVDVPVTAWLGDALNLSVTLENDGVAAAIGEWRFGAGRGLSDFVYVTVSTGIGGGVIADGRVLRGRRRLAGALGHVTTAPEGAACACGNRGCWEAQASGTALGTRARQRAALMPASSLFARGAAIDARLVVEAAREGDALAAQLVAEEAELLGIGIANLLHLFSPEAVVLGGGVSAAFDLLQPGILRTVQARALPPFRGVPVVAAQLGQNSGLVGAACLVLQRD